MKTVQLSVRYLEKLADCLQAHSIAVKHNPTATANYLATVCSELRIAVQNAAAATSDFQNRNNCLEIEWCEANMAFALTCNGELVDHFPTRAGAEAYAKQEKLATGMGNSGKAAEICG